MFQHFFFTITHLSIPLYLAAFELFIHIEYMNMTSNFQSATNSLLVSIKQLICEPTEYIIDALLGTHCLKKQTQPSQ